MAYKTITQVPLIRKFQGKPNNCHSKEKPMIGEPRLQPTLFQPGPPSQNQTPNFLFVCFAFGGYDVEPCVQVYERISKQQKRGRVADEIKNELMLGVMS